MTNVEIFFKKLHPGAEIPKHYSTEAVGLDLSALLFSKEDRPNNAIIPPRNSVVIRTGLAATCSPGFYLQVVSRSGLARRGIFVTNQPGIIDPDYRGEIHVLLYNGGMESQYIKHGDRIAQLLILPALYGTPVEVEELDSTERGSQGFGSTGR